MLNKNKYALLVLLFSVAKIAAAETADLYASTAEKNFRSPGFETTYSGLSKDQNHIDSNFYLQTNFGRKKNIAILGDVISKENLPTAVSDFLIQNQDLSDLVDSITTRSTYFGTKFATTLLENDYFRFGASTHISGHISNLWTSKDNQEKLAEQINTFQDAFVGGGANPLEFSQADKDKLAGLARETVKNFGIGDFTLFIENDQLSYKNFNLCLGAEAILPLSRINSFGANLVPAALNPNSRKITTEDSFSSQPVSAATAFIENTLNTIRETALKSRVDLGRFGVGLYARPSYKHSFDFVDVEIFANLKGNYMLPENVSAVAPVKNHESVETSAYNAKKSNMFLTHDVVGISILPGDFNLTAGYDFYYQSCQTPKLIANALTKDNATGKELVEKIAVEKTKSPSLEQHKLFASLGYTFNKDADADKMIVNVGLGANYSLKTKGGSDNWGASVGAGIKF